MGQQVSTISATATMTSTWNNNGAEGALVVISANAPVSQTPVDETIYTASTVFGSGSNLGDSNYVVSVTPGATSVTISGLTAGFDYFVKAYGFYYSNGLPYYELETA